MTTGRDGTPEQPHDILDLAQSLPTPTDAFSALALFATLELAAVEEGRQTLEEARATIDHISQRAAAPAPIDLDLQ